MQNPGALTWGLVSCTGIALAFLVAVLFPFFSTVSCERGSRCKLLLLRGPAIQDSQQSSMLEQ